MIPHPATRARMRIRRAIPRTVAPALGLLLGLLVATPRPAQAEGGWWGDLDKGLGVRLADVVQSPERFRGRLLTFPCVFHRVEREFNPLRTRFHVERYDNVSVWPDGAPLWQREAFAQDFPFLYVARAHAQRDALVQQATYTRLEVTARIEAIVDGYPFLEVTAVRATGHKLGAQVMERMLAGEVFCSQDSQEAQELAVQRFRAALEVLPDLAPVYDLRIRERLAQALRRLGRDEEAGRLLEPRRPPAAGLAEGRAGVGTPGAGPASRAVVRTGSPDGEEVLASPPDALPAAPPTPDLPLPVPGEVAPARRARLQGVR